MSKVSIITPAYNAVSYLEETVRSVQAQTFTDWEMVIVDDCSTDGTYELAQKLAERDARIKVGKNIENSGVAVTRNNALDMATGDYIAFLDSDDLWLPDKLSKQIEFMENGGYAISYTAYQKFDSHTGKKGKVMRAPLTMTAKQIYGDTSIGCLTVMVNRKMVGSFYMPRLKHMEDNITWQEILMRGYVAHMLDEVLALYREGNSLSLTGSKKKAAKEQWLVYREYYNFSFIKSLFYFTRYVKNALKKHFF